MPEEPMVVGVDIGTYLTKVVVIKQLREDIPPSVVAWGTSFTEGMRKGAVIDENDVAQSVNQALREARNMLDEDITEVYASIGGSHLSSYTRGEKIAVSKADGEVSADDVNRLIEHVSRNTSSMNKELLQVVERSYVLDDTAGIHDPVGMHGIRLELEGLLIEGDEAALKAHTETFSQVGLDVTERYVSILAASEAVLTKKQQELGVVVVDIGASTTSLVVYEERTIIHMAVIPIGASYITNDLAIGMKTSVEIAELAKVKYGYVSPDYIPEDEVNRVQLSEFSKEESASFPTAFIAEVIEARVQEIFQFVNQELAKVEREGLLPAGAVLTGGGANIRGIAALAKQELDLPAKVGYPEGLEGNMAEIQDPMFATVVGVVRNGMPHQEQGGFQSGWKGKAPQKVTGVLGSAWEHIQHWFRKLFPE